MQNQTAQLCSSLLQFPEVTIKGLQEDEINLDSVLRGKFVSGKTGLAWLACGPQLEVANFLTAERLSAYRFSGVTAQPPTVVAVREFSWQKKTGLLVGLEDSEGGVLCLYDVGISKVVKAVVLPGSVTALEPVINHGGANASTQHLHQSLRWFFGVAAVVTNDGHVLLIDLCLDDVSSNQDELEASDLEVISGIPTEIPMFREAAAREHRHLCLQLQAPTGTPATTITYISRTNQLAVGFSDGYLTLWNMKTLRREYRVQVEGGRIPINSITFQEPENDPRHCCYLWVAQTNQSGGDVSLHLLQMAFGDRKCSASGQILYENLEYCEERYSLDLSGNSTSLRGQTARIKLLSCQTVEKFRAPREDGIHEVTSPETSISIFGWQVHCYGQNRSNIYLGVFDINRWYQAQMPDSLRQGQFLRSCSYFAFWSLEELMNLTDESIIDILVQDRSLNRGAPPSYPPPEQFFYPSTYNFDAACLLKRGIVHLKCAGFHKETLHFLKNSGYSLNEAIPEGFNRCLVAGLLSPRHTDVHPANLSQDEKLQAVLSAAVDTSSHALLASCIKHWTSEEQPRCAANLRFVLEWTWNKMTLTKEEFDRLCVPLFDGSCNFIDPQTLQSLQHCHLRFSNLTTVLSCFLTEAQEVTIQGLMDLTNKQSVGRLLTLYASVVLWFCRIGLLPDNADESMQLTRPYYNYDRTQKFYSERRKKMENLSSGKWKVNSLMIDGMTCQFGNRIEQLWSRDGNGTGKYPPSSLQALLDLYLIETAEEMSKHAITIYFLLDVMYSLPDKPDSSIDSFPTAFSIPFGLIKLIQGFWLLDRNDCQNAVDCILHPGAHHLVTWQHLQIIESLMCLGDYRQALRYIKVMNPPITCVREVILHMTVLLANRQIMEAWNLQRNYSTRLNIEELLKHAYEVCSDMGLLPELMKLTLTQLEQEHLQRFLETSGSVQNKELLLVHYLLRANYVPALQLNQSMKAISMNDCDRRVRDRAVARNTMFEQYAKVLPRVHRTLANERANPYMSSLVWKEVSRPKPLSTVAKPAANGSLTTKASFIRNVLCKIQEVSDAYDHRSFPNEAQASSTASQCFPCSDAFLGTPLTKIRRISRLLDSVVQPSPVPNPNAIDRTPCPSVRLISSSPIQLHVPDVVELRSVKRAEEFNLLDTPLVVKRAKALASTTSSGYIGFTPQSILRSSVRTTPLVSPSVSPGRSLTPPLRPKETKISFMEEIGNKYEKTVFSSDRDLLEASPVLRSAPDMLWSESKVQMPSFSGSFTCQEQDDEIEDLSVEPHDESPAKMSLSKEAVNVSLRSDETTLEYHDAPTPEDMEDDVLTVTTKPHDKEMMEEENEELKTGLSVEILEQEKDDEVEGVPPKNDHKVYEQLIPVQDIERDLEPLDRPKVNHPSAEVGNAASVPSTSDSASVIIIHDSEIASKQELEQHTIDDVEAAVTLESSCAEIREEKEIEIQLPDSDIHFDVYESSHVGNAYNIENIEHHYNSEIVDAINCVDNEMNDAEGEHFAEQNNFTLVLEGGEEDATEMQVNREDHFESLATEVPSNIISLVTKDGKPVHEADTFPIMSREHETSVPEPVKIDKNLLDCTAEINSENVFEPLSKVPNLMTPIQGLNCDISACNIKTVIEIPTNTLGTESVGVDVQDSPPSDLIPIVVKPQTPRRSIRNISKLYESAEFEEKSLPTTPRRGRKAKGIIDNLNDLSNLQEEEVPVSIKRITRKIQNIASESSSNAEIEGPSMEFAKEPSTPTRTHRATSPAADQIHVENEPAIEEPELKPPSTPTRVSRGKLLTPEDQMETESNLIVEKTALIQPSTPTRSRKGKLSRAEQIDTESKLILEEIAPRQPSTPTRAHRGKVLSAELQIDKENETIEETASKQQTTPTRTRRGKLLSAEEQRDTESNETKETASKQPSTPTRARRGKVQSADEQRDTESNETIEDTASKQQYTPTRARRGKVLSAEEPIDTVSNETIEETASKQPSTTTRARRGKLLVVEEQIDTETNATIEETAQKPPSTPTRARRGKLPAAEEQVEIDSNTPVEKTAQKQPSTPTRARRGKLLLVEEQIDTETNATIEETAQKPPSTPTRARRGKLLKTEEQIEAESKATAEESAPKQSITSTRTRRANLPEPEEQIDTESNAEINDTSPKQPTTPTRARRGKLKEPEDHISMNDQESPPPHSRITRSQNIEYGDIISSQKDGNEHDLHVSASVKGRQGRRLVNELVKHFELGSSQPDSISPPVSPNRVSLRWTRNRSENKILEEVFLKAIEETTHIPRKRSKTKSEEVTELPAGTGNEEVQVSSVTNGSIKENKKMALSSVSEEVVEDRLQLPESQDQSSALNFAFSTPVTKRKKIKVQETGVADFPGHLKPQTSSEFVFSPPSTRTRRLRSAFIESVKNEVVKLPKPRKTGNTAEEPVLRKRGRPPKDSKSKAKASWSPPPVEIQLLSPPKNADTIAANAKSVAIESTATEKKTLKRNKRKIVISKPVSRRKLR
ncbi:ELYS [Pelobates cultripes]|uniref:ELYS n=1 Tax=Pelobates cultripes TaxID=61616 RepID=A0AAD1RDL1_PELCU|nr:ELYS [Pelobates cultripes]